MVIIMTICVCSIDLYQTNTPYTPHMLPTPDTLYILIGKTVIYLLILILLIAAFGALLIIYSFKTSHFIFPNLILFILEILEDTVKYILRFAGIKTNMVDQLGIELQNKISLQQFKRTPINKRVIFLPQCLRAINCPAKLTPEGIQCTNCGKCEIGEAKKTAEQLGYRVFIVPGSSFIKRMTHKYKPESIIGVGCMSEIKSGLQLCNQMKVNSIGITLQKAGCVATVLDWDTFYELIHKQE